MNRATEKPVIKCWEVNINKYQSLSIFGRYLPGLLEYIDVKCYGLVGCGSVRFGILNRFDGLDANLGHSTQRRHYLWIIYDQLFIITYFSGIYATWKNCACIILLEQWPNYCNQRLYSILSVFFSSCFSFSPGLCAHYLSRNRINFHKSHREPLHLSPELTLQLPVCHANIYHCNSNLDGMLTHSNQRSRKFNIVTFYQLSYFSSPPSNSFTLLPRKMLAAHLGL